MGLEMNGPTEEEMVFEMVVVVPKRNSKEEDENCEDCVEVLVKELRNAGFIVARVTGFTEEFIKLAAPLETLGRAAAELQMRKPTYIGMDLQFEWEEVEAFMKQPDGSLFSWCERFHCYESLLHGIINKSKVDVSIRNDGKEFLWEVGESLLRRLEIEGIVKQVFPLHDETNRKKLMRDWVLNWRNFTNQPIDEMYMYFGLKIAIYFAFLRMYTRWLLFPAGVGLLVHLVDFGSLQLAVLPVFFISIILWAALFFQFWKRKNSALLARWQINCSVNANQGNKFLGKWSSLQSSLEVLKYLGTDIAKEKEAYQRSEWFGYLLKFRNNAIVILSIICLQLPFELAYAHLYEVLESDVVKFGLTALYLVLIQYFTKIGGKISMKLIQYENYDHTEYLADSLVYKVFGLYFMQTYIGVFYHALLHRNFKTLRQVLIQRVIIYQVLENLLENSLPYIKYSYKKFRAVRNKKNREDGSFNEKIRFTYKVEKEYLKPTYSASVADELDGLFDEFLVLALQFGMIMMFACAFPLAFAFAAVNCLAKIRTDALRLLSMLKRPVPRSAVTIGAWLNIFQFLIVMSICTNSALLVWLYDQEGKWKLEPGLAAILVMEHVLLLIKFGFSRFVPEEPAWVRANRVRNATQAQNVCSKQLLRSLSVEKLYGSRKTERTTQARLGYSRPSLRSRFSCPRPSLAHRTSKTSSIPHHMLACVSQPCLSFEGCGLVAESLDPSSGCGEADSDQVQEDSEGLAHLLTADYNHVALLHVEDIGETASMAAEENDDDDVGQYLDCLSFEGCGEVAESFDPSPGSVDASLVVSKVDYDPVHQEAFESFVQLLAADDVVFDYCCP